MGGEIGVESEEGRGADFWFTAQFALHRQAAPSYEELRGKRILVADDNSWAREIISRLLHELGCQAETVASGALAMAALRRQQEERRYDLLLLDWSMPELNGLETVEQMRRDLRPEEIPPVVLVSAYGNELLRDRASSLELAGYMTKPLTLQQLHQELQRALSQRALDPPTPVQLTMDNQAADLQGKTLLVVDDHDINRQVIRELVEFEGLKVVEAASGRAAISLLEENPAIDAVLMDMQMPELDGPATTRIIRQNKKLAAMPVVAVTANIQPSDRQACLEAGMDDFVPKPVEMEALLPILQRLLAAS